MWWADSSLACIRKMNITMSKTLLSLALVAALSLGRLHAQESLTVESLAADRGLWPREVTIKVEHQLPVIINGRQVGSSKIAAGRTYPLKIVTREGVKVDALGAVLEFPAADTDLLERARKAWGDREAQTTAASSPSAEEEHGMQTASTAPEIEGTGEAPDDAEDPPTKETPSPSSANAIGKEISGDLVSLADGRRLKRLDNASLESKKYLAVYFSAAWCGPCREFTPKLVEWYGQRTEADHGKFEVILMSRDRSAKAMEDYMKDDKMPWPALAFTKRDRSPLAKYSGRGIPCLIIIDGEGNVLSDSYVGDNYVGPSKVLKDLEKLLAESS